MEQAEIEKAIQAPAFLEGVVAEAGRKGSLYVRQSQTVGASLGCDLWLKEPVTMPTLTKLFAERMAGDLDELRLHGDKDSEDPFLAMFDGSNKLGKPVRLGIGPVQCVQVDEVDGATRVTITVRVG